MDRKMNDLDDVESFLKERRSPRVITKKRNGERQRARKAQALREIRIERGIVTLPTIIVVLICIVLILEPFLGVKEEVSVPETTAVESSAAVEETTEAETKDESVQPMEDSILMNFFTRYFDAKLSADVDTLDSMSGIDNDTEEQKQQLAAQLKVQAGYIEKYQNLELYGVEGMNSDELLVFLRYDVKFRRAETVAPAIMYCYMKKTEDGGYQLIENRSPEQVRFINSYTTEHPEVQELINSVNSELLEALSSDSRLAVLYDAFQTGRIYKEDQAAIDSEVSLISVETEAATTAAETTAAESSKAKETTKASTKETTAAQQSEHVVEAVDPGEEPVAGIESAAEGEGPVAPGGDVIEAAGNPGA